MGVEVAGSAIPILYPLEKSFRAHLFGWGVFRGKISRQPGSERATFTKMRIRVGVRLRNWCVNG